MPGGIQRPVRRAACRRASSSPTPASSSATSWPGRSRTRDATCRGRSSVHPDRHRDLPPATGRSSPRCRPAELTQVDSRASPTRKSRWAMGLTGRSSGSAGWRYPADRCLDQERVVRRAQVSGMERRGERCCCRGTVSPPEAPRSGSFTERRRSSPARAAAGREQADEFVHRSGAGSVRARQSADDRGATRKPRKFSRPPSNRCRRGAPCAAAPARRWRAVARQDEFSCAADDQQRPISTPTLNVRSATAGVFLVGRFLRAPRSRVRARGRTGTTSAGQRRAASSAM